MNLFGQILPWALTILGAAAFVVIRRRHLHAINEQRLAKGALEAAHIRLSRVRQAIDSATDAIGIGDFEGNSTYHNAAHIALFGYTVEELNATPDRGVLFADREVGSEIHRAVTAGQSWVGETDILTKAGRRIPAFVRADIIRDEAGKPVGIFGIFRDITRERARADEAARASKLESLGMMAGGIAHDFNNLLTVVIGHVNLAQMEKSATPAIAEHLGKAERAVIRASEVARQLTTFAKGDVTAKRLIAPGPVVSEAVNFAVQNSIVRLDCALPSDLALVDADEAQLIQVFNNLALNAVQAMPQGGTLTVKAANHVARADSLVAPRDGRWVLVTVADTGVGIPAENLRRIFDPFFTTKAKGTGLGLATSHSIVERHGGYLRVQSEPGKGTTFQIYLPAAADVRRISSYPANVVSKAA